MDLKFKWGFFKIISGCRHESMLYQHLRGEVAVSASCALFARTEAGFYQSFWDCASEINKKSNLMNFCNSFNYVAYNLHIY